MVSLPKISITLAGVERSFSTVLSSFGGIHVFGPYRAVERLSSHPDSARHCLLGTNRARYAGRSLLESTESQDRRR
jgi:hypothetical protein